jgi:3-hydroxyacyl-[acyl-carrier-protein] dehydratase
MGKDIINKSEIMRILPYRYPMLLLDGVSDIENGQRVCAYKDVANNEFWCEGHFPGEPVMPGVLIAETMAQAAALIFYKTGSPHNTRAYLSKIENMTFIAKVVPGCRLVVEAVLDIEIAGIARFKCKASVNGADVAKGTISCYIMKENDKNE